MYAIIKPAVNNTALAKAMILNIEKLDVEAWQ